MGRLDDKIAIVTGGGQGIGQAIARKLAAEGATVVVTDLDEATAKATADALPGAVAIRADVTDRQGIQAMAERVAEQFGRIDVLVNNAGWDKASPFVDSDPADWDRAIAINLYGVLHTCKAVLPVMAAHGSGAVVNLGSDAGRVGSSGEAVYSAAKGGIIAFTKKLAYELGPFGVTVNAIAPSLTLTERIRPRWEQRSPDEQAQEVARTPLRRVAEAADQARVICFLASADADFVTGVTIDVTGGV
jgi:2-hydroxycyclohexanecarboxyl-CoA dehydrogenase